MNELKYFNTTKDEKITAILKYDIHDGDYVNVVTSFEPTDLTKILALRIVSNYIGNRELDFSPAYDEPYVEIITDLFEQHQVEFPENLLYELAYDCSCLWYIYEGECAVALTDVTILYNGNKLTFNNTDMKELLTDVVKSFNK